MSFLDETLAARLSERRAAALYRTRRTLACAQQPRLTVDGRALLSFCSNDYLGLANHPAVLAAFHQGIDEYGVGSGASHLVCGHSQPHELLENELASFTGRSRALVFSSGYMANVGVLTALLGKKDQVFEDRLNHASLLDGGLFSGARFKRYPHLDADRLDQLITKSDAGGINMLVTDGVFSMDGDVAPLESLINVAQKHNATLMVDDAHGFGCLGSTGGGLAQSVYEQTGVAVNEESLPVLVGTFGKAFGTAGAFVAGSETLIEALIQFSRPYIYTTAMPAAVAQATRKSLVLLQSEHWRREHLQGLINQFREGCAKLGFALTNSTTPIQGLLIGEAKQALAASTALEQAGMLVTAIREPTVPAGTARLRITFSASHSTADIEQLLQGLAALPEAIRESSQSVVL